jgi:hypothetical protein
MSITDLREQAKLSFDHAVAKKNLTERMESRCTVTYNGGVFRVSPELFILLRTVFEDEEAVIVDSYDTPVLVNRTELLNIAKSRYREVTNEWLAEWNKLKQIRKAEDV